MYNQLDLLIPEAFILCYVVCETNKAQEMLLDFCISFISYTVQKNFVLYELTYTEIP